MVGATQIASYASEDRKSLAPWFQPKMTRDEAELLLAGKPEGTFLLRASQGNPGSFTLNVSGGDKIFNFLVKNSSGKKSSVRRSWHFFGGGLG